MGGPRASTLRRIHAGIICCWCHAILPERGDDCIGERTCLRCIEKRLIPVWMVFRLEAGLWHVGFVEANGETPLPWAGRFRAHDKLYAIARASYQPIQAERELESRVRLRKPGRVKLRLTQAQLERLRRPNSRSP